MPLVYLCASHARADEPCTQECSHNSGLAVRSLIVPAAREGTQHRGCEGRAPPQHQTQTCARTCTAQQHRYVMRRHSAAVAIAIAIAIVTEKRRMNACLSGSSASSPTSSLTLPRAARLVRSNWNSLCVHTRARANDKNKISATFWLMMKRKRRSWMRRTDRS
jgi:hypothetical protein